MAIESINPATGETLAIDAAYVDLRLAGIVGDDDLSRYIL